MITFARSFLIIVLAGLGISLYAYFDSSIFLPQKGEDISSLTKILDLSCGESPNELLVTVLGSDGRKNGYLVRGNDTTLLPSLDFPTFCGSEVLGTDGNKIISWSLTTGARKTLVTIDDRVFYPRCHDSDIYFSASARTAIDAENKFANRRLLRRRANGAVENLLPSLTAYQIGRPFVARGSLIVDLILPRSAGEGVLSPPALSNQDNFAFRFPIAALPLAEEISVDQLTQYRVIPSWSSVEQISTNNSGKWMGFYSNSGQPQWHALDLEEGRVVINLPYLAGSRFTVCPVDDRAILVEGGNQALLIKEFNLATGELVDRKSLSLDSGGVNEH